MINRLTSMLEFQAQALSLRAERQRIVASNIANADTPGYQARDFNFAAALREASGSAEGKHLGGAITSDLLRGTRDGTRFQPRLQFATPSQTSLDGNSVDMDRERAAFADNSVKYEATLRFINGNVRTMLDAIKGGQ